METFKSLREIAPQRIWEGVLARVVEGDTMSFALVELAPNSVVAEHQHHNEQMGIVLRGSMTFTIGGEPRLLHTGDTYNIPGECRIMPPRVRMEQWSWMCSRRLAPTGRDSPRRRSSRPCGRER